MEFVRPAVLGPSEPPVNRAAPIDRRPAALPRTHRRSAKDGSVHKAVAHLTPRCVRAPPGEGPGPGADRILNDRSKPPPNPSAYIGSDQGQHSYSEVLEDPVVVTQVTSPTKPDSSTRLAMRRASAACWDQGVLPITDKGVKAHPPNMRSCRRRLSAPNHSADQSAGTGTVGMVRASSGPGHRIC